MKTNIDFYNDVTFSIENPGDDEVWGSETGQDVQEECDNGSFSYGD